MKIAIAQINTTIGDHAGNKEKILGGLAEAESRGAEVVVFPELSVTGYPPKDLLENADFVRRNLDAVEDIAKRATSTAVVLGFVSINTGAHGRPLFNSVGLLYGGEVKFVQHKTLLPEYDVFDEARHFEPAGMHGVHELKGKRVGLTACEDMWSRHSFGGRKLYHRDPMQLICKDGCDFVMSISASPFTIGKQDVRRGLIGDAAKKYRVPIVYCNLVGGNDELVFDGRSFVVDREGRVVFESAAFREDFSIVDLDKLSPLTRLASLDTEDEVISALELGLGDYMKKCGFKKAIVGLSGGIDSAVVAAIACRAIGPANVVGVLMPSPYTSQQSIDDAMSLATGLGMGTRLIPVTDIYESYRKTLGACASGKGVSVAEENIQARIRGNILMALSNEEGALVLSTGNKSELSVGYCTLYGDMAGGFALISDIPKTLVYKIAKRLNKTRTAIPESIIVRPPTAELKPNQTDQDTLPPYDVLDAIISFYVEDKLPIEEVLRRGFDRVLVEKVVRMIEKNEYKRRQAAPGIKITSKAFGTGRRLPIARKFI
jgi:NAD+ synthetase